MSELNSRRIEPAKWGFITVAVALAVGALLYRWLRHEDLSHTAALFLGIPTVLAILLALAPRPQSVTGVIVKGMTLFLLVIAPLLGEGYLCILIASPLFYLVGIATGQAVDYVRKKRKTTLACISLVLLPICLEGVFPATTWNRSQSVAGVRVLSCSAQAVEEAMAHSPNVREPLPALLAIGFPRPLKAYGEGLWIGATRTIHFSGAEGDPEGDLVLRVSDSHLNDSHLGYVRFVALSDASKVGQWLRWQSSEIAWQPIDANHTRLSWSIRFERQLDPAWYFAPWERLAVDQAADFLIRANATPAGQR